MRFKLALVFLCLCLAAATASAEVDARMLRYPDVSETHIAFVYAGDIWLVEKGGGTAHRLSSPPGEELFPRFSPDGSQLAFTANYDGNTDIYVIPSMGGAPVRLTHHPESDRALRLDPGWQSICSSASRRTSGIRSLSQFYLVSPEGGFPKVLPVPYGEFGALSPTGRDHRLHHPGPRLSHLEALPGRHRARHLALRPRNPRRPATSPTAPPTTANPMWHGDTLYFLSDRGPALRSNIWALDTATGEMRQITHFTDFDITFPAIGPSDIVFQAGGRLYLLGLDDEAVRRGRGRDRYRPRQPAAAPSQRRRPHPGRRHLAERQKGRHRGARRALHACPAKHGVVHNLSRTSGAAERFPAWSPDGKNIAYWSDAGGEYELDADARRGRRAEDPDQPRPGLPLPALLVARQHQDRLHRPHPDHPDLRSLEADGFSEVDKGLWMLHPTLQGFEVSWSSDSRWIAYSRGLETDNSAIFLFDTENGTRHQVTSGYYFDFGPGLRPGWQVPLLLVQPHPRSHLLGYRRHLGLPQHHQHRRGAAARRRPVTAGATQRRGGGEGGEGTKRMRRDEDADKKKGDKTRIRRTRRRRQGRGREEARAGGDRSRGLRSTGRRAAARRPATTVVWPRSPARSIFHRMPRLRLDRREQPIAFYDLEEREEETILDDATGFVIVGRAARKCWSDPGTPWPSSTSSRARRSVARETRTTRSTPRSSR